MYFLNKSIKHENICIYSLFTFARHSNKIKKLSILLYGKLVHKKCVTFLFQVCFTFFFRKQYNFYRQLDCYQILI